MKVFSYLPCLRSMLGPSDAVKDVHAHSFHLMPPARIRELLMRFIDLSHDQVFCIDPVL